MSGIQYGYEMDYLHRHAGILRCPWYFTHHDGLQSVLITHASIMIANHWQMITETPPEASVESSNATNSTPG